MYKGLCAILNLKHKKILNICIDVELVAHGIEGQESLEKYYVKK
jgi:hypothetical protein